MVECEQYETKDNSIDIGENCDQSFLTFSHFLFVTGLLILAELFFLLHLIEAVVGFHVLAAISAIVFIQNHKEPATFLFQSLLLVPILRISDLAIPLFTDNQFVFLGVLYSLFLMSTLLVIRSQSLTFENLGLTLLKTKLIVPGLLIGIMFGALQHRLALEQFSYELSIQNYIFLILVIGLLITFVEEMIFRGLILRWAVVLFNEWIAIIIVSVLYAFMHSVWLSLANIAFSGCIAILLGGAYVRWNNMWFIMSINGAVSVSNLLLAPLYFDTVISTVT